MFDKLCQNFNMTPRLYGKKLVVILLKIHLSLNSQRRLARKENQTKCRSLTIKSRSLSYVGMFIYRTRPIAYIAL